MKCSTLNAVAGLQSWMQNSLLSFVKFNFDCSEFCKWIGQTICENHMKPTATGSFDSGNKETGRAWEFSLESPQFSQTDIKYFLNLFQDLRNCCL